MTLLQLFAILFLVSLVTIGGGYAMLPLLHRFFVEDLRWLTQQEFLDAVAVGQVTPGPLTTMNAFIGHKVAGVPGALVAAAGTYLPSLVVMSLVSRSYGKLQGSRALAAVLRGVKPAVVGMLVAVGVSLAGTSLGAPLAAAIGIGSFAVMAFTRTDPTFVVIAAGLLGAAFL
ncbi:MAG TPA: chromate transporter [Anaeromyxobacter sp.]